MDFTFVKTADRTSAGLGETITYTYSGTNTGAVPLQVTQLVDDRLGVLIGDPGPIVAPGGTLTVDVQHTVTAADVSAGSIENTAVVTARATGGPDQGEKSAVAGAHVDVVRPPEPIVASLSGSAACDPATGSFGITWTLSNGGSGPLTVVGTAPRAVAFQPQTVAPGAVATGQEQFTPTPPVADLDLSVTVDDVGEPGTQPISVTARTVFGQCEPPLPPTISFTFTKKADRDASRIGETITYTYAGTNTGDVPLRVDQLVDDHLHVLVRPADATVVRPGESIRRKVTYRTTARDASAGVIPNAAVVSIRAVGMATNYSAVAVAKVRVIPPRVVPEPPLAPDRPPPAGPRSPGPRLPDVGGPPREFAVLGVLGVLAGAMMLVVSKRSGSRRRSGPRRA